MRLLILVNNPNRASFRLRGTDFLGHFRQLGIVCDVRKLPRKSIERWRLFVTAKNYDAVLLHRKCLNFFDAKILFRYARKAIFDHDDAIMYSTARPERDHTSHFRLYKRTIQRCECVISGNEYLAEHARRFCANVHVVPTGLDIESYLPRIERPSSEPIRLIWIGSASTLPYLEQLEPVLEELGKNDQRIILRIVADKFFDLKKLPLEKCHWSLETQATDLQACDIGLAPLPYNRFTRGKCGFKILQYFAAGLPVIASPVGVNDKFITESDAGVLASTPQQWKEAIQKLAADATLRKQMGLNGKRYVRDYDVSVIAQKFCQIIKDTIMA